MIDASSFSASPLVNIGKHLQDLIHPSRFTSSLLANSHSSYNIYSPVIHESSLPVELGRKCRYKLNIYFKII